MVKNVKIYSLKVKLLLILIFVSILPVCFFTFISLHTINKNIEKEQNDRLLNVKNFIINSYQNIQKDTKDKAKLIANITEIRQFIKNNNHQGIVQVISPLASEIGLDQIIVTDKNGISIGRSDIPSEYNINMKDILIVKAGLIKNRMIVIEKENSSIFIKSVSDVKSDIKATGVDIIGTVVTGYKLDKRFIDNIIKLTGCKISLYLNEKEILSDGSISNDILTQGYKYAKNTVFNQYNDVFMDVKNKNKEYGALFFPLLDHKNNIIAMCGIFLNKELITSNKIDSIKSLIMIILVNLVIMSGLIFIFSKFVFIRLDYLKNIINIIKNGNLSIEFFDSSNDEIATLVNEFNNLKNSLKDHLISFRNIISTTDNSANIYSVIVEDAKQKATELKTLAASTDRIAEYQFIQLKEANQKIEELRELSRNINISSENINKESDKANITIEKEKETIMSLISKMYDIEKEVNSVNTDIYEFKKRFKEMNKIIKNIFTIADRIKILSLNASIEAAKTLDINSGFSIIAQEISKLSQETNNMISSIENTINGIVKQMNNTEESVNICLDSTRKGVKIAEKSNNSLIQILDIFKIVNNQSKEIYKNINLQYNKLEEISESVYKIVLYTQENLKDNNKLRDISTTQEEQIECLKNEFDNVKKSIESLINKNSQFKLN